MNFNTGVHFASKNVICKGKSEVKTGKLSKATLEGHIQKGSEGDHGRCVEVCKSVMAQDHVRLAEIFYVCADVADARNHCSEKATKISDVAKVCYFEIRRPFLKMELQQLKFQVV